MKDLDDELRRWAREQTDNAPQVHVDVEQFSSTPRRAWLAPLAAAAAVVVVAGGVLAIRPWESDSPTVDRAVPLTGHPGTTKLSGSTRESVFHGLAIDVPATWPDNATQCGTPVRNTLVYPTGATAACAFGRPDGVTSVEWNATGYQKPVGAARTTTVHIGSVRGTRTVGVLEGARSTTAPPLHVVRVVVPTLSAQVEITSPSAKLANQLAATVRVVTHDQYGCAVRNSVRTLSDVAAPSRPGTDHSLVPGAPSGISLCWYEHGFLEHGTRLNARDTASAARLFNGLDAGLSITDPHDYLAAVCQPNNRFSEVNKYDIIVVHIAYGTGKPLTLVSRIGTCGRLGITNGRRNGQFDIDLWEFFTRHVGGPGSAPGKVLPVR